MYAVPAFIPFTLPEETETTDFLEELHFTFFLLPDTLNRQVRIANNMLGCDIDFIIKDLDTKSRSVVASRKDAMLKKRQIFYLGEEGEKPLLYPGRIAEARVIAVAPKAVRLEVFGVEVSVRARDMAWEWMLDEGEKFQVGDLVQVMVNIGRTIITPIRYF